MTSCGSGVSALVLTLALYRLGVRGSALYDGSWAEWGLPDGPPVATGPAWNVAPIADDIFRVRTPNTLSRGWFDVRAIREEGRVSALLVSGGRVKRVRYDRVA